MWKRTSIAVLLGCWLACAAAAQTSNNASVSDTLGTNDVLTALKNNAQLPEPNCTGSVLTTTWVNNSGPNSTPAAQTFTLSASWVPGAQWLNFYRATSAAGPWQAVGICIPNLPVVVDPPDGNNRVNFTDTLPFFSSQDSTVYYYQYTALTPSPASGLLQETPFLLPRPTAMTLDHSLGPQLCTSDSLSVTMSGNDPQLNEGHSVALSWNGAGDWFRVYRSNTSGGPYTQIADCVRATSYTDRTVQPTEVWYYVTTAVVSGQESNWSNETRAGIPPDAVLSVARGQKIQLSTSLTTAVAITRVAVEKRTITQTLTTSAALTTIAAHSVSVQESLSTSTSLSIGAPPFARLMSESLGMIDTVSVTKSLSKALSESSTTSASISRTFGVTRSLTQALTTSASMTRSKAVSISITDTLLISASLSARQGGIVSLSDTTAVIDQLTAQQVITSPTMTESLTTSDAVTVAQVITSSHFSETLTTTSTLLVSTPAFVRLSESYPTSVLYGCSGCGAQHPRSIAEALTLLDAVSAAMPASTTWQGQAIYTSGPGAIPAALFGLHFRFNQNVNQANTVLSWPSVPFGSLRLWDTDTRWQNMNPATGSYNFAALDSYLSAAKAHGLGDVLLTLSATPQWAASNQALTTCDYPNTLYLVGNGDCSPPSDLNADGTGTDQAWRTFVYNLAKHIAGLDSGTFSTVNYFAFWNEFTRGSTSVPSSWLGTNAELERMSQDANCILTGRGTITATSQACSAPNMNVLSVGILPSAKVGTPDAVPQPPDATSFGTYLAQTGALNSTDFIAVHAYGFQGLGTTYGELVQADWNFTVGVLPSAAFGIPVWSTEGGWGSTPANIPDSDLQMAYIARYYLVGWSSGFSRLYWYAVNNSFGTLINQNGINGCNDGGTGLGCPTPAASAWTQVYGWMVGNEMTSSCAGLDPLNPQATVWQCGLTRPDGTQYLAVWDSSQSCSGGVCTTSPFVYPNGFTHYFTLANGNSNLLTGGVVQIGAKPILLGP